MALVSIILVALVLYFLNEGSRTAVVLVEARHIELQKSLPFLFGTKMLEAASIRSITLFYKEEHLQEGILLTQTNSYTLPKATIDPAILEDFCRRHDIDLIEQEDGYGGGRNVLYQSTTKTEEV